MIISTISNDEATIRSFVRDPEFAEYLMKEVIADGDANEIHQFRALVDEANVRRREVEFA